MQAIERIRPLLEEDLPSALEIWLHANLEAHAFIPGEYFREKVEEVGKAMQSAQVWVYERDGQIMGFLGLQGEYIAGLFVRQSARGEGIGGKLIRSAKERHSRLRASVYQKNSRALAFYQREGFHVLSKNVEDETGQTELQIEYVRNMLE